MRQSFRRAGLLVLAAVVTLAGVLFVTGTASAAKSRKTLSAQSVTQACEVSACAKDVLSVPAGQPIDTFCAHPGGKFNLSYTNPTYGRGGYIPVGNFAGANPLNTERCGSFSGSLARPRIDTILGSCSGPCVTFGNVQRNEQLRAFCHLPPNNPQWLLVYVPRNTFAGFVRVADLDPGFTPSVPSCNQGF